MARKLWRLDTLRDSLYLLLLSPGPPDFTGFRGQFRPIGAEGEVKGYDALLGRIATGKEWQFRLKANATYGKTHEGAARGARRARIAV